MVAEDDLTKLAADLLKAEKLTSRQLRGEFRKVAEQARDEWRAGYRNIPGRRLRHLPASVTYETSELPSGAQAEIGPDKEKSQGPLASIVEFGTSRHGPIAPMRDQVAAKAEERLVVALEDIAKSIL